jgi:hypothetical protein
VGRVIGKRGATAQSLRTLLRALGTKNDARYNLKIIDNGTGPPPARATDTRATEDAAGPAKDDTATATTTVDDEPVAEAAEPPEEDKPADTAGDEEQASDRLQRARAELADLDDLDV